MKTSDFTFPSSDGTEVFVYMWAANTPKGVVQIAHGMGEHAGRYARLARALVEAGYTAYANDHRGHGRTARDADDLGVFGDSDGWNRLVEDMGALNERIKADCPGLPVVLLGHSMGSAAAQQYLVDRGDSLTAAALSGSTAFDGMAPLIETIAAEAKRLGPRGKSDLLDSLSFGAFNQAFEPARTPFDWLSRDEAEVDAYIADEHCGFTVTAQALLEMLEGALRFSDPAEIARIPKNLPVFLTAGDQDPVNNSLVGLETLLERYRAAGIEDLGWKFYPGARHEVFNETNRDEVTSDLIEWLNSVVPETGA
ncbi:MAG: alpha/beta hydrolase [bacterium]|nr:alpha/beta hydrolase [bacterium]